MKWAFATHQSISLLAWSLSVMSHGGSRIIDWSTFPDVLLVDSNFSPVLSWVLLSQMRPDFLRAVKLSWAVDIPWNVTVLWARTGITLNNTVWPLRSSSTCVWRSPCPNARTWVNCSFIALWQLSRSVTEVFCQVMMQEKCRLVNWANPQYSRYGDRTFRFFCGEVSRLYLTFTGYRNRWSFKCRRFKASNFLEQV